MITKTEVTLYSDDTNLKVGTLKELDLQNEYGQYLWLYTKYPQDSIEFYVMGGDSEIAVDNLEKILNSFNSEPHKKQLKPMEPPYKFERRDTSGHVFDSDRADELEEIAQFIEEKGGFVSELALVDNSNSCGKHYSIDFWTPITAGVIDLYSLTYIAIYSDLEMANDENNKPDKVAKGTNIFINSESVIFYIEETLFKG